MNKLSLGNNGCWSPLLAEQVDEGCDCFEVAWKSAGATIERPRIEDYLGAMADPERSVLLNELVFLDIYYRRLHGEDPQPADYSGRFPGLDQNWLAEAVAKRDTVRPDQALNSTPQASVAALPADPPTIPGYKILGVLGRGGMGVIYQARQVGLNRLVALKMMRNRAVATSEDLARFAVEAEAEGRLQHPNIAHIYEIGEYDGCPYFSFELLGGGSLDKKLGGVPLPVTRAVQLVETLARAVHYAHQRGILHRDLKPANVLLTTDGVPKISDFGLAKLTVSGSVGQTQSGTILGTPGYMAPEQTRGRTKDVGPAVDVYALGAILYETLTGRPPFLAETPLETMWQVQTQVPVSVVRLQPNVPRDLNTICMKCLQKEPRKRYASAEALADDLRRLRSGEPILARPIRSWERAMKWARRRPAAAGLIGVTGAGILLLFAGQIWHGTKLEHALEVTDGLRIEAQNERDALLKYAYAAHMKQAHQFWQRGDVRHMLEQLSEYSIRADRRDVRDFVWYYLWALCHNERLTLRNHTQDVYFVAFSPDGKLLATAGRDATVKLWDAATGDERATLRGHTSEVNWVAFSPDGKMLVTASDDHTVRLWDTRLEQEQKCLRGHTDEVLGATFSPDGKLLASAGKDKLVKLWDPVTGQELASLPGHTDVVESLAFSPDGQTLATTSRDKSVILWDVTSRRQRGSPLVGHKDSVQAVVFSPDGRVLATGSTDRTVKLWDAATGVEQATLRGHTDPVQSVSFSPDGKSLVSGSDDCTLRLWDVASREPRNILKGHTDQVWCVRFSPDGQTLASTSVDGTVKLWDPTANQEKQSLPEDASVLSSFAFAPTSRLLAAGRTDGTVRLWDLATRRVVGPILHVQEGGGVFSLGFSRDGRMLAAGSSQGNVALWDFSAGQTQRLLKGNRPSSIVLTVFPDDRTLAIQTPCEAVQLWDVADGRLRAELPAGANQVVCQAVSPDGQMLATWTGPDDLVIWDLTTYKPRCACRHQGLTCIAFSADGQLVATGGLDRSVRLWDARSGRECRSLLRHADIPVSLAFSPDGKILATSSKDRKVRLWQLASGQELVTLEGYADTVKALAFAPNGEMLAGAGETYGKSEIYLWPAPRVNPIDEN